MESVSINKFEVHYFFTDDSHTMDAFVRNKCEAEALALVKEILLVFEGKLEIETEPYSEGGLKQIWKFIGKNQIQITIIINILTLLLTKFPDGNSKLESLQEEKIKLEIEEKRINLQRLKKGINDSNVSANYKNNINDSVDIINTDLKVIKHRSNFYSNLKTYHKITQISATMLTDNNRPVEESRVVKKVDFDKFILESDNLPINVDDQAEISIISPVLKKGKYKWRGMYQNESIEFYMKDQAFKESILEQKVSFKNGVSINCKLEISKKLNELGYEQVISYNVLTVLAVKEGDVTSETEQGKQIKKVKEAENLQFKLPFK